MATKDRAAQLAFGGNNLTVDQTGKFTVNLVHGGQWIFDFGEINRLDEILREISSNKEKFPESDPLVFWRTDYSKIIEVWHNKDSSGAERIYFREGGTKVGYFWSKEVIDLRRHISTWPATDEGEHRLDC